jgi:excisionase family DNA binding protein
MQPWHGGTMPKAQLPALSRNERTRAAKASRERNDGRPLLTIHDAAAHLGKSRDTVYRLIRTGDLRTILVGGTLRIRPSDLDDYLDKHIVS